MAPTGMILCLRGTNGSGKTTAMLAVMAQAVRQTPQYGLLGPRRPEAYALRLPGVARPVYVLGPYERATGGCDMIQPYDGVLTLIPQYAAQGHVLFEGVLISSSYGRVGRLMEQWGPAEAVMLFLTTSLAKCIRNVLERRAARGDTRPYNPHNLTTKFHQIARSQALIQAAGRLRVVPVSATAAPATIQALLQGGP